MVASLATYGVGYVARPIGTFVLGHGDVSGPGEPASSSACSHGLSTMAVGLVCTYAHAGVWVPALLVVSRLVQALRSRAKAPAQAP